MGFICRVFLVSSSDLQVRKEMLLTPDELRPFQNRSTQMAALDYQVSIASDTFIATYDGNMAKVVEGHRRFDFSPFARRPRLTDSLGNGNRKSLALTFV